MLADLSIDRPINLEALKEELALVLDDYHVIAAVPMHERVAFLLGISHHDSSSSSPAEATRPAVSGRRATIERLCAGLETEQKQLLSRTAAAAYGRRRRGKVAGVRRAFIVLLVLLLLLAALPVGMGMSSMADCPACAPTSPLAALGLCLAILGTTVILAVALFARRLYEDSWQTPGVLLARRIDRPPQSV